MRIEGFHTTHLQRFIKPILTTYLELNLKTNNLNWYQRNYSSEEFIVKLTDEQGNPIGGWNNKIDLTVFFKNHNIKSKLEFINHFEQN